MGIYGMRKYRRLFWWILIIVWCIFIFYQSDKPALDSANESSMIITVLNNIVETVFGTGKLIFTETIVRKAAHIIEYIILGYLLFNGFTMKGGLILTSVYSLLAGAFYAQTDEIHQFFVPGRAMMLSDVAIDVIGVLFGVSLMCYCSNSKRDIPKKQRTETRN